MDPDIVCRDTSGLVSAVSSTLFLISLCPLSCSFQAASLFVLFTLSLSLTVYLHLFSSFAFVSHNEHFSLTIYIYGVIAV